MLTEQAVIPNSYLRRLDAKVGMRCFVALIYGVAALFLKGFLWEFWPDTYLMVVGGFMGMFGVTAFRMSALQTGERSWRLSALAFSGLFPCLFGLYLVVYCGGYRLYLLLDDFDWL